MHSNIDVLVSKGLSEDYITSDIRFVTETCSALVKIVPAKSATESSKPPLKFSQDHELFTRLSEVLVQHLDNCAETEYNNMLTKAISVIYMVSFTRLNQSLLKTINFSSN